MSITFDKVTNELYHKGVKGMKWKNHTYESDEELVQDSAKGKESSKNNKDKENDKKASGMSDKKKANIKKYIEDVIKHKVKENSK